MTENTRFDQGEVSATVTELVARTRSEEARVAMALITRLRERGVTPGEMALVTRRLDPYEALLTRAARRYGIELSFWTQLQLQQTRPYQLVLTTCRVLGTARPSRAELLAPLAVEWVHPDRSDDEPLSTADLDRIRDRLMATRRSLDGWQTRLTGVKPADERVIAYLEWLRSIPTAPTATDIRDTLAPVVETYKSRVLPRHVDQSQDGLRGVERVARATVRVTQLVPEVADKYANWIAAGHTDRSWQTVASLCESIATHRPGRREHASAEAIDVIEANDVWGRQWPYVIALGLVDGLWPQQVESEFPVELRQRIDTADSPALATLALPGAWQDRRERDQFLDTVRAATTQLLCLRYRQDQDGIDTHPSPYLETLERTQLDRSAVTEVLGGDSRNGSAGRLPERIVTHLTTDRSGGGCS